MEKYNLIIVVAMILCSLVIIKSSMFTAYPEPSNNPPVTITVYTGEIGNLDWNYFHNEESIFENPDYFENVPREAIMVCYTSFLDIYSITDLDVKRIADLPNVKTVYPAFLYESATRLNSTQVEIVNKIRIQEGRPLLPENVSVWHGFTMVAIDPKAKAAILAHTKNVKGRFLDQFDDNSVVINEKLERCGFGLGMNLSALSVAWKEEEFRIVGVYEGFPGSWDNTLAIIDLHELFNSLELVEGEGRYNWLYVEMDDVSLVYESVRLIREILPNEYVSHH